MDETKEIKRRHISPTGLPGYYTAQEASKKLGYADYTMISRMCREGRVFAYKVGHAWLIPEHVVDELYRNLGNTRSDRGVPRG